MLAEVMTGLRLPQKTLSPKFFYDEEGSRLFEEITRLEAYYPTRTELAILRAHAGEMASAIGPEAALVEFGSGASAKVHLLLDRLERPRAYVPIDISAEFMAESAAGIAAAYPNLAVVPVAADYTQPFDLPDHPALQGTRRAGFFPGSTIGNFPPDDARGFLGVARDILAGGGMVIGVDRKKDAAILNHAYNDPEGVTAAFNLNMLRHLNRTLGADFELAHFAHRAHYNEALGRIEMHLVSERPQTVRIDGKAVRFAAGESIHTESSYKYTVEEFAELAAAAGWRRTQTWSDPDRLFSVHYLEPA